MIRRSNGLGRHAGIVLLALLLPACERGHGDAPPSPVRPVLSVVVEPQGPEALRTFSGTVEARYQSDLGFQTAGRMIARTVNVGDVVAKGRELATLDATVQRLAVASAEADLANAEAQLTNALATFDRQALLIKTGSTTQAGLDAATAGRDTAQARVNQQRANLDRAQQQLGYTALVSDENGVVASWSAEIGQVVAAAQTVVTIARPNPRDAVFDIPDDLIARFDIGARFTVRLLADESVTAEGVVREVAPLSDAATRSRRVRLTLAAAPPAFRLGTTVRAGFTEGGPPRIELPETAILDQDGKAAVWLVRSDKVVRQPVSLAGRGDGRVVVASGLSAGDRVVTAGVHSLSEGQAVRNPAP